MATKTIQGPVFLLLLVQPHLFSLVPLVSLLSIAGLNPEYFPLSSLLPFLKTVSENEAIDLLLQVAETTNLHYTNTLAIGS